MHVFLANERTHTLFTQVFTTHMRIRQEISIGHAKASTTQRQMLGPRSEMYTIKCSQLIAVGRGGGFRIFKFSVFCFCLFVIIWLRKTRLQTRMRRDTGEFRSNISAINDNYNMATSYMYKVSILSVMMTIWQTKGTLII